MYLNLVSIFVSVTQPHICSLVFHNAVRMRQRVSRLSVRAHAQAPNQIEFIVVTTRNQFGRVPLSTRARIYCSAYSICFARVVRLLSFVSVAPPDFHRCAVGGVVAPVVFNLHSRARANNRFLSLSIDVCVVAVGIRANAFYSERPLWRVIEFINCTLFIERHRQSYEIDKRNFFSSAFVWYNLCAITADNRSDLAIGRQR